MTWLSASTADAWSASASFCAEPLSPRSLTSAEPTIPLPPALPAVPALAEITDYSNQQGDLTEEGGYRATRALLRREPRPTAIFAPNDLVATGALSAADELETPVPTQLSIVGYDNTHLAAIRHISLTSVDQPRRDMGRVAAELLTARIGDPARSARQNLVVPHLVVRSTTGPAPVL